MTSFQQVAAMNEAFGNPKGNPKAVDWNRLEKQCKNILDEYIELMAAIAARDPTAVRDALGDVQVFAMGGQHFIGVDGDADMKAIIDGVMTRFIKNDADQKATVKLHKLRGVTEVYFEGEYPTMVMKSAVDQPDAPKGKFLKSASYKETVFSPIK